VLHGRPRRDSHLADELGRDRHEAVPSERAAALDLRHPSSALGFERSHRHAIEQAFDGP
jgi:hypothetical protein